MNSPRVGAFVFTQRGHQPSAHGPGHRKNHDKRFYSTVCIKFSSAPRCFPTGPRACRKNSFNFLRSWGGRGRHGSGWAGLAAAGGSEGELEGEGVAPPRLMQPHRSAWGAPPRSRPRRPPVEWQSRSGFSFHDHQFGKKLGRRRTGWQFGLGLSLSDLHFRQSALGSGLLGVNFA